MKRRWKIAVAVIAVATAAFPALLLYGPERVWKRVGPADLGPVDFAALSRSTSPNDALAATPGILPERLRPDFELPTYSAPPATVLATIEKRIEALGDEAERVQAEGTALRYVTRSPTLRFPDTTVIEAIAMEQGTGVRAYARATVGKSDFGANRARLERWLLDLPLAAGERR